MTDTPDKSSASKSQPPNAYRWYSPRCWHGMRISDVLRIFAKNRFAFSPTRVGMGFTAVTCGLINSVCGAVQSATMNRKVDAVEIEQPPVFIVGHWRSGTTMLHEMMVQDERFDFPDTFECFEPNHFLVTSWWLRPLTSMLLPKQRPMDNMPMGWGRPQEDEFGLMSMGLPSVYEWLAFPNRAPPRMEYLDMEGLSEAEISKWQQGLLTFLKRVAYRKRGRLVLKSPPHLGRVKTIAELFPDAKWIHIVRDPYVVYSSTMRLWSSLPDAQGFQVPNNKQNQEYVLTCFERMYAAFEKQRSAIPAENMYEVRYEDLVQQPLDEMRTIYEQLDLGEFDAMRPRLEQYLEGVADYRPNRHSLPDEERDIVTQRWGDVIERYGYGDSA